MGKEGAKKGERGWEKGGKKGAKKKGKRVCARNKHDVAKLAFWQGNCALIWTQVGSFLPLWPYKKRRFFEGSWGKMAHSFSLSCCLKKCLFTRISNIKGADWPLRKPKNANLPHCTCFTYLQRTGEKKGGKKGKEGRKREQEGRRRGGKEAGRRKKG